MKLKALVGSSKQHILLGLGVLALGLGTGTRSLHAQHSPAMGYPQDWSQQHVVFRTPRTAYEALQVQKDPRYWLEYFRRNFSLQVAGWDWPPINLGDFFGRHGKRDWSMLPATASVGVAGVFPAKFNFSYTTATCNDFIVYPTGVAGTAAVPSIIAYNNLYKVGCSGANPTVYWSYNTTIAPGTGACATATVKTSPVLSIDGTQVAFVELCGTAANLAIITTKPNSSLVSLTGSTNANTCTAPCIQVISINGTTAGDTVSSPYVDYLNNVLYVGNASGQLFRISNIFSHFGFGGSTTASPAALAGAPWPVAVEATAPPQLTSPVYDSSTGLVYVGDAAGFLSTVGTGFGGTTNGAKITSTTRFSHGSGFTDSPLLDAGGGFWYVVAEKDETSTGCTATPFCISLLQFPTSGFVAATTASSHAKIGTPNTGSNDPILWTGTFDNNWFTGTGTAHIYACGNDNGATNLNSKLYQVVISTFAVTAGPSITNSGTSGIVNPWSICSPVTEFANGTHDYLYMSVPSSGSAANCTGACIYAYDLTSGTWNALFGDVAGLTSAGGTGGIIIDNSVTSLGGTQQVYYWQLGSSACAGNGTTGSGTGSCAVQASQSGLN